MLQQVGFAGEQILTLAAGVVLVGSRSQPGGWHIVNAGACDCKSFQFRGRCRHVVAVAQLGLGDVEGANDQDQRPNAK